MTEDSQIFRDAEAFHFATNCLALTLGHAFDNDAELGKRLRSIPAFERVNVTLRTHGRLRGSMSAQGDSFGAQLESAVFQAAVDKRFDSRVSSSDFTAISLEIWIQTSSEVVPEADLENDKLFAWGVQGIEINADGRSAYYKPSVPLTSAKYTIDALLSSLCRKAGLQKKRWREPGAEILRTTWRRIWSPSSGNGLLSAEEAPDPESVAKWLGESAEYLLRSRQASGDFTYLYDPIRDREVFDKPSRVRSAGCLYALSCFLDSSVDGRSEEQTASILSLAQVQVGLTRDLPGIGLVLPEPRKDDAPKMGSTALLALALGGRELSCHFADVYRHLCRTIDQAQQPNGRFLTHFGVPQENVRSSEFFSGQALLTLVQRATLGEQESLARIERAFAPYREQFSANPTSAFVGWHVDVWTRMATLTGQAEYAEFAFMQVDWLLKMQITKSTQPLHKGGFSAHGSFPKFSSIVFLEATVRAYILARERGEVDRVERYGRAVQLGVKFCGLLRLTESRASWFADPARCRGGISLTPLDLRVRCDVPQHFITLAACLLSTPELLQPLDR